MSLSSLCRAAPCHINIELDRLKDSMLLPWLWRDCINVFCFSFSCLSPPLFRVKPLHYISWLIGHEGTGSILSVLRRKWVLLPLSVLFFSDLRALQKHQLKGIQFAGYTWAFSCCERATRPTFKLYTSRWPTWYDSYILIAGICCTRGFHPLLVKWQSDLLKSVQSHNTTSSSNSPFTISATLSVWMNISIYCLCCFHLLLNDNSDIWVNLVPVPSRSKPAEAVDRLFLLSSDDHVRGLEAGLKMWPSLSSLYRKYGMVCFICESIAHIGMLIRCLKGNMSVFAVFYCLYCKADK